MIASHSSRVGWQPVLILLYYWYRDELYVQLMKQLRKNDKEDSVLRGWQMLALTVETFSPSDELLPFFLHFVQAHLNGSIHCVQQARCSHS